MKTPKKEVQDNIRDLHQVILSDNPNDYSLKILLNIHNTGIPETTESEEWRPVLLCLIAFTVSNATMYTFNILQNLSAIEVSSQERLKIEECRAFLTGCGENEYFQTEETKKSLVLLLNPLDELIKKINDRQTLLNYEKFIKQSELYFINSQKKSPTSNLLSIFSGKTRNPKQDLFDLLTNAGLVEIGNGFLLTEGAKTVLDGKQQAMLLTQIANLQTMKPTTSSGLSKK